MKRAEAMSQGLRFYIGKPCPHGHDGERYTAAGNCVVCAKISSKERGDAGYYRKRYHKDPSRFVAMAMDRYRSNRDAIIKKVKAWAVRNPDARRAIANSYKHRRRSVEATGMSGTELARWTTAQLKICFWCNKDCVTAFHVDHFYPLSKGGSHLAENLVIACPGCNRRKNAKDPIAFAAELRAAA